MTASTGENREPSTAATPDTQRAVPADTLAARLMLSRMHAGHLSIREAADRCGLIHASWANWEQGMRPRDLLAVVHAISDGLDIDHDWLLFGGPLVGSRGTPTGRRTGTAEEPGKVTREYPAAAVRPRDTRPPGGPPKTPPVPGTRRAVRVDQLLAA